MTQPTKLLPAVIVAILVLAVGFSACGDEDGSADIDVTTSALRKPQLVKRANRICRQERAAMVSGMLTYVKQNEASDKSAPELNAEAIRAVLVPTVEDELDELRRLGAPSDDEGNLQALLDAGEAAVESADDLTRVEDVVELEAVFEDVVNRMDAYGLTDCAATMQFSAG